MPIDLTKAPTQTYTLTFTDPTETLTLGNQAISYDQARWLFQKFESDGELVLKRSATDAAFISLRLAQRRGDQEAGARGLVLTIEEVLPTLGVKPVYSVNLKDMPRRDGAADAALAAAAVIEAREPPSATRDSDVATLRQQASVAEVCGLLREAMDLLERQVGGNEVPLLLDLKQRLTAHIEPYRHRLEVDPLLKRDLQPVLDYLDGSNVQRNNSRKRNDNWRATAEARITEKVSAAAREEGRREATSALTDRLTSIFDGKTK